MANAKRRQLESAVSAIHLRYGEKSLRKGSELPIERTPPHISTGFAALDAITGCQGVPLGAITLLSGPITSGKLTIAYKTLVNAQQTRAKQTSTPTTAILDFSQSSDPDYLTRCGVDLDHLLLVRTRPTRQAIPLLLDLIQTRQFRLILLDSLAALSHDPSVLRSLNSSLERLHLLLQNTQTALIAIDEPSPLWQRWLNLDSSWAIRQTTQLHLELRREQWLTHSRQLTGYQATATLLKSRWARSGRSAPIHIIFNGTVKASQTW